MLLMLLGVLSNSSIFTPQTITITQAGRSYVGATTWVQGGSATSQAFAAAAEDIYVTVVTIPIDLSFSHIYLDVSIDDSSTSDYYSWGLYSAAGTAICTTTKTNLTSTGVTTGTESACSQTTPVTILRGNYILATTGNATTAKFDTSSIAALNGFSSATSSTTASSGQIPSTSIAVPSAGATATGIPGIDIELQ